MRRQAGLVALPLAVLLSASCAGSSCDELRALRAERDQARADYLDLARSPTATTEQTSVADEELHELERQVHDLEQTCD